VRTIDRKRVKVSFHKGASDYDQHTPVQKRVIEHLLNKLKGHGIKSGSTLLDIGCGTGLLLDLLSQSFPYLTLTGLDLAPNMIRHASERLKERAYLIQGDAEHLPFTDDIFSIVLSSSTFQWLDNLNPCFDEIFRILKPEGRFLFTLFGEGTLKELRESWQEALSVAGLEGEKGHDGTHRFHNVAQVRSAMELSGFSDIKVYSENEEVWYQDVPHLLHSIKRIGAGTSRPPSGGGLGWRRVLHEMAEIYNKRFCRSDGAVTATYNVIYGEGTA
jgi:malonyl-CoA O-methyltransferase